MMHEAMRAMHGVEHAAARAAHGAGHLATKAAHGVGHAAHEVAHAAGTAEHIASKAVHNYGGQAVHGMQHAASSAAHGLQHAASSAAHSAAHGIQHPSSVLHGMQHAASSAAHGVQHAASAATHGMQNAASSVAHGVQEAGKKTVKRASRQVAPRASQGEASQEVSKGMMASHFPSEDPPEPGLPRSGTADLEQDSLDPFWIPPAGDHEAHSVPVKSGGSSSSHDKATSALPPAALRGTGFQMNWMSAWMKPEPPPPHDEWSEEQRRREHSTRREASLKEIDRHVQEHLEKSYEDRKSLRSRLSDFATEHETSWQSQIEDAARAVGWAITQVVGCASPPAPSDSHCCRGRGDQEEFYYGDLNHMPGITPVS